MGRTEVISIKGERLKETANAILWKVDSDMQVDESVSPTAKTTGIWIPFSQVEEIHSDSLVVTKWIADKKGLV